jgi:hypothetical protein
VAGLRRRASRPTRRLKRRIGRWDTGKLVVHLIPWFAGEGGASQGCLDYPYADRRPLEHFVLRDVRTHQRFGSLTGWHFRDGGSTLSGTHVAWEGARSPVGFSLEYDSFREPTATETDRLHLARLGLSELARLSHSALLRTGLGFRAMVLDDGRVALGPEIDVGTQVFPLRPLAFDGTFRVAGLTGAGASWLGTVLIEASTGAGVLVGRVELRAGLRWLVIGYATTLAGPTLGTRIWF